MKSHTKYGNKIKLHYNQNDVIEQQQTSTICLFFSFFRNQTHNIVLDFYFQFFLFFPNQTNFRRNKFK